MAFDEEEFADETSRQIEMDSCKQRIECWKRTQSYITYKDVITNLK